MRIYTPNNIVSPLFLAATLLQGCSIVETPTPPIATGAPFHTSTRDVFTSGITQEVSKNFGVCGKDLAPCIGLTIQVEAPPAGLSEEIRNFIAKTLEAESSPLKRTDWLRPELALDETGKEQRYASLDEFLNAYIEGFKSNNTLTVPEVVQGPIAPGAAAVETTLTKPIDTTTLEPWRYAIRMATIPSLPHLVSYQVARKESSGANLNQETLSYLHFSKNSAKLLSVKDLIQFDKLPQFMKAAERHFRNSNGIFGNQPLNNRGFSFPDGAFALAKNYFITPKALHMIYQPGEIAEQNKGNLTFAIPIQTVKRFLTLESEPQPQSQPQAAPLSNDKGATLAS
jgi:hypothetical protein